MLKPRSTNDHANRESYLRAATNELRLYFAKLGLTLPDKIRFAVAFTSHGKKGKVAGECWHAGASDDGHHEIIIRADFADPAEVLGILVHELVHAALPPDAKHGKVFREAALRIGLEGQMRHALPGAVLRERLNDLATSLGPFPHGRLNFDRVTLAGVVAADKPKKQGTRMLKAECLGAGCGYTVRVAAKPGTLGLAIDAYHRTPAWAALRPKTRISYERAIAILEPLRDMPLIALNRSTIIRLRDDKIFPRHGRWMANYVVTFLGILLPFCRDYDFIKDNPLAERVKKIRKPWDGLVQNRAWTEEECRIVLEKAPPYIRVPIALAMCAGLRKADVLTVTKAAIAGGMITVTTAKREKEISAPIHPLLADAIKALPASGAVQIAVNSYGQPWSETGFNSSWSKFRNRLRSQGLIGPGLTIHGLRHTLGTRLKEAGADDGMIADILGNTIPRHYSSGAKLSQKAKGIVVNLNLDGNKTRPKVSTPD